MTQPSRTPMARRLVYIALTLALAFFLFVHFSVSRRSETAPQIASSSQNAAGSLPAATAPQHAAPPPRPAPHRAVPKVSVVSRPSAPAPAVPVSPRKKSEVANPEGQERLSPPSGPGSEEGNGEGPDDIKKRMDWFYGQRAYPLEHIPGGAWVTSQRELEKMIETQTRMGLIQPPSQQPEETSIGFPGPASWTLIGPQRETGLGVNFGNPLGTGRVNILKVNPATPTTVFLGAATGGVWKSTDSGTTWNTNFDQLQSPAIGGIAIAPSDANIIYVGTGEINFASDNYYGAGVYKSIDGGANWTQQCGGASVNFCTPTGSGRLSGGFYVGNIAVNPTNALQAVAAARNVNSSAVSGIYRTTDGGANWTLVPTASGAGGNSVVWVDNLTVWAALGQGGFSSSFGIYKSVDGGATFTKQTAAPLPTTDLGRFELVVAPSDGNRVYVGIGNAGGTSLRGLAKTIDGGANWTFTTPGSLPSLPNYCTGQCFYDMPLIVHPTNPDALFAGGGAFTNNSSTVFRSLDGGATWVDITTGLTAVRPHVDAHAFAFTPTGDRLYAGNDGGVWFTTNPTAAAPITWQSANNPNLAITQFYPGHARHPSDENLGYGGTQDNGWQKYTGSLDWTGVTCGDGAWAAIDRQFPTTVYANCQNIDIRRSTTDGNFGTFSQVRNEIGTSGDRVQFIPPLVHDPTTTGRLYFGTFRIWQTMNYANNWTAISPDLTGGGGVITTIAAGNDGGTVYAGTSDGRVQRTTNAFAGAGATWTNLTTADLPPRFVTMVAVDRADANTAYAAFSGFSGFVDSKGHIFKTINGGISWTDISGVGGGALPNTPVNDVVIDRVGAPFSIDSLYVATDIGVFKSTDAGTTWTPFNPGGTLPRVPVTSLKLREESRSLLAATHGRSVWIVQLFDISPTGLLLVTSISPHTVVAGSGSATITLLGNDFGMPSGQPEVRVDGSTAGVTVNSFSATLITATFDSTVTGTAGAKNVTVFQPGHSAVPSNPTEPIVFSVQGGAPTITSLVPSSVPVGGPAFDLTVNGTGFVCAGGAGPTVIRFRAATLQPNVGQCTATQIVVNVPSSQIVAGGTVFVSAFGPPPGGGPSNSQSFNVQGVPPPNDNFANAINILTVPFTNTQDTTSATTEVGEPDALVLFPGCTISSRSLASHSVWYKYTPSVNGTATFTTLGESIDGILQVVTGSALGAFTPVPNGCNDNFPGSESVTVSVTAGTTYSIMVSDFAGAGGTSVLNLNAGAPPPVGAGTTRTFTNGGGDGLWTTAANWNPSGVPASGDTAVIPDPQSVTLNTGAQTITALNMTSTGTLTISGTSSLTFTSASTATNITISNGTLTANASLAVSGALGLNNAAATLGGSGTVTVSSPINWSAGTMASPGTTVSNGTTNWSGGTLGLGRTFNNNGTMNLSGTLNLVGTLNNSATGTVNTSNGGILQNLTGGLGTFSNAGTLNNAAGSFQVSSITFTTTGSVNVNAGSLAFSGGSYTQTAGTTTVTGGASLGSTNGVGVQGGILRGTGTISATLTNNGGAVNPGTSAGTLTVLGNYNQGAGGTLNIEIGGTAAGNFDVLTAGVTAVLDGTLNVTLINAFTPVLGDSFTIMTFPARIGTFASTNFPALGGGLVFNITYNAGSVVLTVSNAPAPVVTLNPLNVPFGNQKVGTTSANTSVTLSNSGNATLNLASLTKAGTDPTQFGLVLSPTGGFTCTGTNVLTAGQSCTFGVNLAPTSTGAKSANIAVASNAPATNLPLTGTGTVPIATPSTGAVPFGDQRVGTTSGVQSVTLTNTGQASLSLATVALGGTNPTQFAIAAGTTCTNGSTVNAGASCVANLTFTPTTTGAKSATLTFTDDSNGVAGSTQVANLTGNGVVPGTGVIPAGPINFGNQPVSTTGAATTFTVTNTGGATLNITNIALTGTDATQFTLTNSGAGSCSPLPKAVAPAANCTFTAAFSPTTTGAKNANATLTDDAGGTAGTQQNIGLSGTGTTATVNLAPSPVNFGNQRKGTTSAATTVTLTNSGGASLNLAGANAVAISGLNAGDFAVAAGTTCTNGATIAANGGTCVINVTFTPGAVGPQTATLVVTDDANPTTQSDTLNGTGKFPAATLSTPALNFNNQIIATTSAAQTLTLQNTGTDTLNLAAANAVVLGGTDAGDFAIAGGTTCVNSATLAVNATCVINITFGPATTGAKSANVTITDDVAPPQSANLTGTGVTPPTATLSQNSLAFGTQRTLTTSAPQTVTVTNSGGAILHISSVAISGANAGDFALATGTTCTNNSTVNGGGSTCVINATFTPQATGPRSATITITDDANPTGIPGTTQTIALSGTGIAPAATLAPPSLNFGNQRVGTTSAAQTITVTNSGTDVLKLAAANAVTITGVNAADFAIAAGTTCTNGLNVPIGGNCAVNVTFTPGATLIRNGTLNIADDASGSPQTASLSGTGIFPVVSLPTSVTFPTTAVSATSPIQTVTLTNTGTDTLNIQANVSISGLHAADFALAAGTTCINGAAVAPTATCDIKFTFTPSANGVRSGTATVTDNANPTTQTIQLNGTTPPTATLSAAALVFGNQGVGTTSAAQAITVTNSGGVPLNISAVPTITGTNPGDFAVATGTTCTNGAAVAGSGGTCVLNVTFHPTATGARGPATLTLTDNAGAGPTQTITLNGTAIDFSLSTSTATATVPAGQPATFNFTATPGANGFPSAVQFSASGLPAATTATFNPASVTPNGSPATTTLTITTTIRSVAPRSPGSPAPWTPRPQNLLLWLGALSLCLWWLAMRRQGIGSRRYAAYLPLVLLLLSMAAITACTSGPTGTPVGTSVVTVTATSGSLSHTTTVTLTVQ